jgi:hypothetical protein
MTPEHEERYLLKLEAEVSKAPLAQVDALDATPDGHRALLDVEFSTGQEVT